MRTHRTLLAALLLAPLLASCAGADAARPLTGEEAQRLALARFRTYQSGTTAVVLKSTGQGATAEVHAAVDHRKHRAVGWYVTNGITGLLSWGPEGLAVARPGAASMSPNSGPGADTPQSALTKAASLKAGSWTRRGYGTSPLDLSLQLALTLGKDRPDNAQLLAQSGASHLRDETVDGRTYGVYTGPRPRPAASRAASGADRGESGGGRPVSGADRTAAGADRVASGASPEGGSPLTYWVNRDGQLRRVVAKLGEGRTTTLDLTGERLRGTVPGNRP